MNEGKVKNGVIARPQAVKGLCLRLRRLRGDGMPVPPGHWVARLAVLAAAEEVRACMVYDPATDRRMEWLLDLARGCGMGGHQRWPAVEGDALVGVLCGEVDLRRVSGKDAAAGMRGGWDEA